MSYKQSRAKAISLSPAHSQIDLDLPELQLGQQRAFAAATARTPTVPAASSAPCARAASSRAMRFSLATSTGFACHDSILHSGDGANQAAPVLHAA